MSFASGLSTHPITAHAVGEVIGQVIERLDVPPTLACVFVSRGHAGALEDVAATVRQTLAPGVLLGCAAESIIGNGLEVEEGPAISLWAGDTGAVSPLRMDPDGPLPWSGVVGELGGDDGPIQAVVLLADPYSCPIEEVLRDWTERFPGVPIVGGMASAAYGPGGNRLLLDDQVYATGAVGVVLGPGTTMSTVVSQGCRPIGRPLVVTRSERNIVYELAGRPALERLMQMARETMTEEDIRLVNQGLHLGLVIDEHKVDFGPGDFLVRNVLGADQSNGAIAVGEVIDVGTTVQFHVRDAASADVDLHVLLNDRRADGVLLFTCNGRGRRLFHEPNHDAEAISDELADPPTAGFFAAGEVGPLGGRNFLHTFTAAMALFERAVPSV